MSSIRGALIEARELRGVTRAQLAEWMGASRHYIYSVEMGQRDPSFDFMARWLKALGAGTSLALFADNRTQPVAPPAPPKRPRGRPRRVQPAADAAE